MAPTTRRSAPARRPVLSAERLASLVALLLAAGCTDTERTSGALKGSADGAAGLSSIVRDGPLKDPFKSTQDAPQAVDSTAQGASSDLKDPFAKAAATPEGSAGVPLKDPFADGPETERRDGETPTLKDPFARPEAKDAAGPGTLSSPRDPRSPFAEPSPGARDAETASEPLPKRPFADAKPTDPPRAGPDSSAADDTLKNPFADG